MNRQHILTEWVELLNKMDKLVVTLENMSETGIDFKYLKTDAYATNVRIVAFAEAYPWLADISKIIDEEDL